MTVSQWLALILFFPALARLTVLINDDLITDWLRVWAAHKFGPQSTAVYFLECPWCVSMWFGFAFAPATLALAGQPWYLFPFLALAGSWVTGMSAQFTGNDDDGTEIEVVEQ